MKEEGKKREKGKHSPRTANPFENFKKIGINSVGKKGRKGKKRR